MDFARICRSCMKKISLRAAKKYNNGKILKMFCFCLNVTVSEADQLPLQFCSECVIKIESSYTFITEAQKVEITLRNLLSRLGTSVIVEPEHSKVDEGSIIKCEQSLSDENIVSVEESHIVKCELIIEENLKPETVDESVSTLECVNINSTADLDEKEAVNLSENVSQHYEDDNILSEDEREENIFCISSGDGKEVVDKQMAKRKNVCIVCLKKFSSKTWFDKHMVKEHSQRKFNCKYCPKTFTIYSKLKEHSKIHSTERNHQCTVCDKRYKCRRQLAEHIRNHDDAKPFTCQLCAKSFKKKGSLTNHMIYHQTDRNHLCNVCGMSFFCKSSLTTHMRTHTGEKPYQCRECPKAFNTSSSLRRHERMHRGEAPHACDTCAKAFSCPDSLARHRRTHTGELPFQCPRCARAFVDSWKRKAHLMRAHGAGLSDIPRLDRVGRPARVAARPAA